MNWLTVGTLVTATMSAVAAIGSWRAARHSAFVDEERHRSELRPQLALEIIPSKDDSKTAVMQVTLKGPVDLPTPGRISLKMMDVPTVLYREQVTVHQIGTLTLSSHGGTEQAWGPWEFQGGLRPGPPFKFTFSGSRSGLNIAFGFCRPTMRFPTLKPVPESLVPVGGRRSRITALTFDGLLFQFSVYLGKRERVMRRVLLGEMQTLYLSRTQPPEILGDKGKDWESYYPPDVWQVLASCRFGRWRWRIRLPEERNASGTPVVEGVPRGEGKVQG